MSATAASVAGPVEYHTIENGSHQLMLFHTDAFVELIEDWLARQAG